MSKAELILLSVGRLLTLADHAETEQYRKAIMEAITEVMAAYEDDRSNEGTDCMIPEVQAAIQKIMEMSKN